MKKILLATALSLCVTSAFAAETAVMKVQGTLTNSACTPELSNGGVVDYGIIRLGELSATEVNQLGQKNIDLTINCTVETRVGWSMMDDQSSTSAGINIKNATPEGGDIDLAYYQFGVGKTVGDVKIGNYGVFVKDRTSVLDGVNMTTIGRMVSDTTWGTTPGPRSDAYNIVTAANPGTLEPVAFKTAVFPLVTSLAIQGTDTLAITDDTAIAGQATISLVYL